MTFTAGILVALSLFTPTDIVIWFEHDSVEISERGERTLQMVAHDAVLESRHSGAPPVLVLEGHADRVGASFYNFELSARRAAVVRARLIALGYPSASLSAVGLGETSPRVPTEDNVAEADNRRVEVRFVTGARADFCAGPVPCGRDN